MTPDKSDIQERYSFHIMNPEKTKGVEYSLWIQEDGAEYPVVSSNTGGFTTFNSKSKTVGDGIEPTDEFCELVGLTTHESLCFMPNVYWSEGAKDFLNTAEMVYDGKVRGYEVWAAKILAQQFVMGDELIPELKPLAEHVSSYTEWDIPVLEKDGKSTDTDN